MLHTLGIGHGQSLGKLDAAIMPFQKLEPHALSTKVQTDAFAMCTGDLAISVLPLFE